MGGREGGRGSFKTPFENCLRLIKIQYKLVQLQSKYSNWWHVPQFGCGCNSEVMKLKICENQAYKLNLRLQMIFHEIYTVFGSIYQDIGPKISFLSLTTEKIMEQLLLKPEGIYSTYSTLDIGIRHVVTTSIIYADNTPL